MRAVEGGRSVAILAGGRASRFGGRDKSALVVEGRTILERQLAELSAVPGVTDVMIVGSAAQHAGARAIADIVPGSGPLGGIHAALTHARSDTVCVIACDMPYVTAALVTMLFDAAAGVDVVVPRTDRGYHPLCAVYTRSCLEPIARRLAEGRLKVMEVFDDVRTRVVAPDHRLLANVNTPQEFAALHGHNNA